MNDYQGTEIHTGDRVELSPATDLWMMGARYGTVVKVGRTLVHVKLDRIKASRPTTLHPINLRVLRLNQ